MDAHKLQLDQMRHSLRDTQQTADELTSEISDLRKIKAGLEIQANKANEEYCQKCDAAAKLCETSNVTKYKVDCCINKLKEEQQRNSWLSNKLQEYNERSDEKRIQLIDSVSEWGKKMTALSIQLRNAAQLYNGNLENKIQGTLKEKNLLQQELIELQQQKCCLETQANDLCTMENDESNCFNILKNASLEKVFEIIDQSLQMKTIICKEEELKTKKRELQNMIGLTVD